VCVCVLIVIHLLVCFWKKLYLVGLDLNDNDFWCFISPEAQKKKESKMILHSKEEKKDKRENKSLTDELTSTFIEELESNSKSCDHYHLVHQIEVVEVEIAEVEIAEVEIVEVEIVEVEMIMVVVIDIVVRIEQS
jgi:hypothetical protein